jgi:hypothetical protein
VSRFVPIYQQHVGDSEFDLEELVDRDGELALTLADADGKRVRLTFATYLAYRKRDEGDALLTLAHMNESGATGKQFYRVEDSDFLMWFNEERCGASAGQTLVHFAIASMNDIVDVIATDEPAWRVVQQ